VVFYNKQSSFLQVIFSTTHWLCTWAILQRHTSQDILVAASHFLTQVAKDFLPGHMGGGLVLGSTIISVLEFLSNIYWLCALPAETGNFQDDVSPRCILLEINKSFSFPKKVM